MEPTGMNKATERVLRKMAGSGFHEAREAIEEIARLRRLADERYDSGFRVGVEKAPSYKENKELRDEIERLRDLLTKSLNERSEAVNEIERLREQLKVAHTETLEWIEKYNAAETPDQRDAEIERLRGLLWECIPYLPPDCSWSYPHGPVGDRAMQLMYGAKCPAGLEPPMALWVVGKVTDNDVKAWEMQGVFSDRSKAIGACKDQHYFVGPVLLDKPPPHETCEWIGAFYPIQGAGTAG